MKRGYVIRLIGSVALVGMVLCAGLAGAEASGTPPAAAAAPTDAQMGEERMIACPCPMCPMLADKGTDMCKEMDVPAAMKQRCQMMMNAEMSKDDAVCLLACTSELSFTPDQVQKLEEIVKRSRQEAVAILTPEQKKTLAEIPEKPASVCEMRMNMHEMMMKNMDAHGPKTMEEK